MGSGVSWYLNKLNLVGAWFQLKLVMSLIPAKGVHLQLLKVNLKQ